MHGIIIDYSREILDKNTDPDKLYFELQRTDVRYAITEEDAIYEHDLRPSELLLFQEEGVIFYQTDNLAIKDDLVEHIVIYDAIDLCRHVDIYREGKYPEDLYK